ncbi:MAG: sulfurtransferase TusA family protein [Methylococcales bacterium]|nr:sulfurtransferase TusA family protein [Methylococcales bacterium]
MTLTYDIEVDASGLNCPLPLLRLKKAISQAESGQVIKIIATDPAAHLDFGVYADQSGHIILQQLNEASRRIFYFQKK